MSLRAHGQRFVSVGNIFSGLFCPLKDHVPPPRIIRRPLIEPPSSPGSPQRSPTHAKAPGSPGSAFFHAVLDAAEDAGLELPKHSWRDDPHLHERQKQLRAAMAAMRPHVMEDGMADALVVTTEPLFKWAHR